MILIDSNIFMYASGAEHPNKRSSCRLLEAIAKNQVDAAIDAEVLQEILHRYRAIERWADGKIVYDLTRRIIPFVVPITDEVLDCTRQLLDEVPGLMARDALHASVCRVTKAEGICTFDRDFEKISGLRRFEPKDLLG